MSQASCSWFAVVRRVVVAGFSLAVGLGAAAAPANAGSAGGLSVSSVSAGVGSGVVSQTIAIASGSPIVGSQGTITISGGDGVFEVSGLTWDASTGGSCQRGSAQSPAWSYLCNPSAAGWGAGSFHLAVNAGSGLDQVCSDLVCTFTTTASWTGPGGPQPSGSVTLTNEADLSVSLNTQAPANSVTLLATDNGPSRVSNAVVTVTGLGDYTVSNVDGQCTQAGSTLTCAEQLGPGQNLFVQPAFSGGSGKLRLHATVSGFFQDHAGRVVSEPDTDSANNSAALTWTPAEATPGLSTGSGPGTGATTSAANGPAVFGPASASPGASTSAAAASAQEPDTAAADAGSGSGSPPSSVPPAAASSTHSAPLDAASSGGGNGSGSSQLWALLAALCIVATGVTSAVMAGKGRHRA